MTHLRLWRFEVPDANVDRFRAAYGSDGPWARLFAAAPGFVRTELWREESGAYLTADHWRSAEAFAQFQADRGEAYRRLDAELEGLAASESFIGAFDLLP